MLKVCSLGLCFFFLSCSSSSPRKSESVGAKKKSSEESLEKEESPEPVDSKPKAKKTQIVPRINSLKEFVSFYRKTLEALGQKKEDSSYVVDSDDLEVMKQQLARLLQLEPGGITFLVNPGTQGSWFGNCTLVIDRKQERLAIISADGDAQNLSLKEKILGGLFKTERGEWVFISAFYGDLQKKVPYRVFWGSSELKVASFTFDRTKEGTIEAQAKSPQGGILNIFRKGRDNKSVQVNGQALTPIFE